MLSIRKCKQCGRCFDAEVGSWKQQCPICEVNDSSATGTFLHSTEMLSSQSHRNRNEGIDEIDRLVEEAIRASSRPRSKTPEEKKIEILLAKAAEL